MNQALLKNINDIEPYSSRMYIKGHIRPRTSGIFDLGSSVYAWKDIYVNGKLNTTNISDIEALILYAKQQGWIS